MLVEDPKVKLDPRVRPAVLAQSDLSRFDQRPLPKVLFMELPEQLINALREALPDCQSIYRFGSWGSAAERSDSDIDLAVLPLVPLDPVFRWELAQRLAALARRDVDLVDLLRASTVLRMQVVAHGVRLYTADYSAVEQFEDTVFSSYVRLNEERRGILDDVRQRGNIYGK